MKEGLKNDRLMRIRYSISVIAICLLFAFGNNTIAVSVNAAETTYVLNKNTKKFHDPDCPSVSQMKEKNKEYTSLSYEEIIAKGYSPCKNCNPSSQSMGTTRSSAAGNSGNNSGNRKAASVNSAVTAKSLSTKADNTDNTEVSYVVNTNTKKFHRPSCSSAHDIKAKNRLDSSATYEELVSQGYSPCKKCNPR